MSHKSFSACWTLFLALAGLMVASLPLPEVMGVELSKSPRVSSWELFTITATESITTLPSIPSMCMEKAPIEIDSMTSTNPSLRTKKLTGSVSTMMTDIITSTSTTLPTTTSAESCADTISTSSTSSSETSIEADPTASLDTSATALTEKSGYTTTTTKPIRPTQSVLSTPGIEEQTDFICSVSPFSPRCPKPLLNIKQTTH